MTNQKKPALRNSLGWTLIVLGVVAALIGALNAKSMSDAVVTFIGVLIIFAALAGLGWVFKRMWDKGIGLPGLLHWLWNQVTGSSRRKD